MEQDEDLLEYPADWYPDPEDATQWRWYDGAGWTELTAPASAE